MGEDAVDKTGKWVYNNEREKGGSNCVLRELFANVIRFTAGIFI